MDGGKDGWMVEGVDDRWIKWLDEMNGMDLGNTKWTVQESVEVQSFLLVLHMMYLVEQLGIGPTQTSRQLSGYKQHSR